MPKDTNRRNSNDFGSYCPLVQSLYPFRSQLHPVCRWGWIALAEELSITAIGVRSLPTRLVLAPIRGQGHMTTKVIKFCAFRPQKDWTLVWQVGTHRMGTSSCQYPKSLNPPTSVRVYASNACRKNVATVVKYSNLNNQNSNHIMHASAGC